MGTVHVGPYKSPDPVHGDILGSLVSFCGLGR